VSETGFTIEVMRNVAIRIYILRPSVYSSCTPPNPQKVVILRSNPMQLDPVREWTQPASNVRSFSAYLSMHILLVGV